MPICITCSTPVRNLYTTYSKADDRSLGKGVRLTQCPKCKRFADKYVEHDYVVLFIDLVLIKPQVYRHLLFNRLGQTDDKLDPSILRLGILLILFDVYITWARIEKSNDSFSTSSYFSNALIITQYLFFLTLNVLATFAQHLTIRLLVGWFVNRPPLTSHHDHQWSLTGSGGAAGVGITTALTTEDSRQREPSPNKPMPRRSSPVNPGSQHSSVHQAQHGALQHYHHHQRGESNDADPPQQPRSQSHTSLPAVINSQHHMDGTMTSPISPLSPASGSGAVAPVTIPYTVRPGHASSSAITTALLVSSCTKLFPILLVIWPTTTITGSNTTTASSSLDAAEASNRSNTLSESLESSMTGSFAHRASSYIGWIVLLNNIEALYILLDCGYLVAGLVAVPGLVSRWLVEGWILGLVGLVRDGGGYGDGPVSDALSLWAWIQGKV